MKSHRFLLLLFSFFLQQETIAQTKEHLSKDSVFAAYAYRTNDGYSSAAPYYIVSGKNDLPPMAKVVRRLTNQTAIVEVSTRTAFDSLHQHLKIAAANNVWKLSPFVERLLEKKKEPEQTFILTGLNIDNLLTALQDKQSFLTILSIHRPANSILIKCTSTYLKDHLLALKEVIFVDAVAKARPETNIIGYDRSFHGINAVDYLLPGANGSQIVAGVKEQNMDETDIDLWKRVLPSPLASTTTSYHATVIASIIGGAGNSSYKGRGIAWGCTFFPSTFANLFADDSTVLHANNVTVQNHSYGTVIQSFYGAEALSYDVLTWNDKHFVPVFSAGNQGESFATEGNYANLSGFANLTGNFKMAKNIITVGAVDDKGNIPVQSSAGPLYDGRIAPQLIALGPSGTSDAAAIVSGTIAVIQQVYADGNNKAIPPASLIKAVLFNTATDIYSPGIDYKTGYGLLDSYAAIKAVQEKKYAEGTVSDGQQWTKNITVPTGTAELKITLAWTDSTAMVNNNKALINDLDLEVIGPNGTVYKPWVLNTTPNADSLAKPPTRKRDSLNTAEQVSVRLPLPGNYQVHIRGTDVPTPALSFSVAFKTDTLNTFTFTSPLHASDFSSTSFEDVTVRWKTFVADTNATGNLYINYTNGNTWQLLKADLKLVSNHYQWQVKDTTAIAVLKMETPFGDFLSNAFLISQPTKLQVDFNCVDSFRLSWNHHPYATAYKIYALTDSPYLKPVFTVKDTFAVMQRSVSSSLVYAVEPVLSNGFSAARSTALNIALQGVHCFYKTLNYYLLDTNKLNLVLELSIADYADSIFFEKVSASGQLLQVYGSAKTNNGLLYSQIVNEVSPGITYLRGRIKLKNGTVVYTDIIPVLTSGRKYIWFYPNPIKRHASLHYVLQQGIPNNTQLLFFDLNGRLLSRFNSLPDEIDFSKFPAGMIIYRLVTEENKLLEAGKLILLN